MLLTVKLSELLTNVHFLAVNVGNKSNLSLTLQSTHELVIALVPSLRDEEIALTHLIVSKLADLVVKVRQDDVILDLLRQIFLEHHCAQGVFLHRLVKLLVGHCSLVSVIKGKTVEIG